MLFPSFYNPQSVGALYVPDVTAAIHAGVSAGISPSDTDAKRIALLLIDAQVDFIHADGALSVPGAVEDTRRTIEWILKNSRSITTIFASLDSHIPTQIFSPSWWIGSEKQHPDPFTLITGEEVDSGVWRPLYEVEWSIQYVHLLAEQAKKQLMIWPYHTLIGTPGHSISPALYEAIAFHSAARQAAPQFITKGTIPQTENYSIFEPEVKLANHEYGELNTHLLNTLAEYDQIYIAGQAKSHCVLESVASIMRYFRGKPEIIERFTLLSDAMSSVVNPGINFDAVADEAFNQYKIDGLRMVTTTEALG